MKKLLITLPSHNEELVLAKTTNTLMHYATTHFNTFDWKILILDNASRDNTRAVAEDLQQQFSERILVDSVPTPGRGGALRESWARHPDYDIYAYMDVDLATDLKDFATLVNGVAEGADLVTGSRYLPQSDSQRSPLRLFLSGVYNKLIRLVLRVNFRDAQCGFKAFSRRLVQELVPETIDRGWFWDTELMILACRRNYRVVELPVTWREVRDERRSSTVTPWREAMKQLKNIAWMWWRLRRHGNDAIKCLFALLLVLFAASRLLGLGQMYHQDEYKWVVISALGQFNPIHPPVASFLFQTTGKIFGFDHVRLAPMVVSVLVWVLVYLLVARLYGRKVALWSGLILVVSAYNFLASIQIDIDGAFLPFFIALLFYAFYRLDFSSWRQGRNYWWGMVLLLALAGGFLTKLSFIVAVGALLTEVLLLYRPSIKTLVTWGLALLAGVLLAGFIGAEVLLGAKSVQLSDIFQYVTQRFVDFDFAHRNYLQVMFLTIKSLIVAFPLLLGGYLLLIGRPGVWRRYRLWWIFLIYNFLFYFVVFDFSHGGTFERYLMFLIIPGAVLAGAAVSEYLGDVSRPRWLLGVGAAAALGYWLVWAALSQLSPVVLPLQPKMAYLHKLAQFDFNFLIPITGGSGPSGFYVSAAFALVMFLITLGAVIVARVAKKVQWRQVAVVVWLVGGLFYNVVLVGELISGWQYGDVSALTRQAVVDVVTNPEIKNVITYYDIGGYELRLAGKYRNRLYTDARFIGHTDLPSNYSGDNGVFLIVDFPEINQESAYWHFFNTCRTVKTWQDKLVKAYLFDCKNGDRSLFEL